MSPISSVLGTHLSTVSTLVNDKHCKDDGRNFEDMLRNNHAAVISDSMVVLTEKSSSSRDVRIGRGIEFSIAFLNPLCRFPGPRQGRDIRMCIITRERLPKSLMWRVVRTRNEDGHFLVKLDKGEGRSAFVSKDSHSVSVCLKKNRLAKALRCSVPKHIGEELQRRAEEWDHVPVCERGFLFAEVYGADGICAAIDEVQGCCANLAEEY